MAHDSHYVTRALLPGVRDYLTAGPRPATAATRNAMMCLVSLGVTAAGYGLRLGTGMATGALLRQSIGSALVPSSVPIQRASQGRR